jgi:hypothetical protein
MQQPVDCIVLSHAPYFVFSHAAMPFKAFIHADFKNLNTRARLTFFLFFNVNRHSHYKSPHPTGGEG